MLKVRSRQDPPLLLTESSTKGTVCAIAADKACVYIEVKVAMESRTVIWHGSLTLN